MPAPAPVISRTAARSLHLAAQGLLRPPAAKAGKQDVLDAIRNMAALQIDTIQVVARSPYLVLWSRLGDFQQDWLDQLLAEGQLFEYWSHEASFLPIEHFHLYRNQMRNPQGMGWKFNHQWLAENRQHVEQIKQLIHANGPVRSADFERLDGESGGWWNRKPEKRSLEVLFTMGELMVARRHNFQRIYDLRERVHPSWNDRRDLVSGIEARRQQVLLAIRALGVARTSWVADYFRMGRLEPELHPERLAGQGQLLRAQVTGWSDPLYVHPERAELLDQACAGELKATATRLLSPFDPVVWDRRRAVELFDFDYRLECYTPAHKRIHGYFSLPILRRGQLVGRLDAKAHRQSGRFEIKSLHWEPELRLSQALADDVLTTIRHCARWHGTPELDLSALRKNPVLKFWNS